MSRKPNIIFILIDDMGWKDLSCYGSEFYQTPNIDRLAEEGMKFSDAYASCPVCSPTRASILSGKYPANVGVTDWIDWGFHTHPCRGKLIDAPYIDHLPLSEKSLASTLKEGGYETWHVGKWHLGGKEFYPEKHGFDINIGGCEMGHPGPDGYFSPYNIDGLTNGPDGENLTDRLTTEALSLIRDHKENGDKPFFLNLDYYAVHTPIMAKEEYIKLYEKKAADMGLDKLPAFAEGEHFPTEHKKDKRVKRRLIQSDPVYAAMIHSLDENTGRLLAELNKLNLTEETIIFFTSDNGGLATAEGSPTCNSPLSEGKGWMYEGGTREPLLIRWPGVIEPGSICAEPVTSPDFYPTILEMAGLSLLPEQHQDGVSLMPLLKNKSKLDREAIFWHYPHYGNQGGTPGSSIRSGDYKLIEFFEDGRLELYNLRDDIEENKNLVTIMPELALSLQQKLTGWRNSIEAKMPQPNPEY